MQLRQIETDPDGYERTSHGPAAFPIQTFDSDIWMFPTHSVPWHWHEECEFLFVTEGAVVLRAAEARFVVNCGQGAFVNSNELHTLEPLHSGACRMDNIVFDPSIIGGAAYSIIQLKYVSPILKNPCVRAKVFTGKEPWQIELLDTLRRIRPIFEKEPFGWEVELRALLSAVWLRMVEHLDMETPRLQPSTDPHIRIMMLYIHNHYAEPLTLKDIAASANVSERTCSRSFRKQLGMSTFSYLMSHRVKEAAQMLTETLDPVTDICFATGFTDTGYFARVFRSITGQTPTDFRRQAQTARKDPAGPASGVADDGR